MGDFPEDLTEMLPEDWKGVARERECGECDACCTVLYVSDLQKPAGKRCTHLAEEGGCKIHDLRPQICRSWFCGWRFGFGTDRHRPDKSGVLVSFPNARTNAVNVFLADPWDGKDLETLPAETALILESLARTGVPIHVFMIGESTPVATIAHRESPIAKEKLGLA